MGQDTRRRREPRGYEKLTVSTSSVGFATDLDQESKGPVDLSLVRVIGGGIRYRDDGTAPTATEGFPLNDGEILEYDGPPQAIRFIRSGGTDATLYILFYS